MNRHIISAVLLALAGLPGLAATLQRLELEEMIEKSTAIVRGQVAGSYARVHGPVIYTHYRIRVVERWKGADAAEVDVVVPGGVADGLRQRFPGAPKLAEGSEYILFLWTGSSGLTNIMGLSQGVLNLKRDQAAGLVASRAATTETMLDSAGRLVRDEPLRMRFEELRGRVSAAMARGAGR